MRRKRSPTHSASQEPRPGRRYEVERPAKRTGPATCPGCHASYDKGRWTWQAAPASAYEQECPACERIRTHYPAGVLRVEGAFAEAHRGEIEQLIQHTVERESESHPLKRILSSEREGSALVVGVTDAKLAQTLGRALKKAYGGSLEHPETTSEKENLVRVRWVRD